MAKTSREEESRRCREFYEKWPFIQRIVELYVEGVSWGGCKVIAPTEPGRIPPEYSQIIDDEALKNGVRDMLVDGAGSFNLKVIDSACVLEIKTQKEYLLEDAEPGGRSFLWPAVINAKAFEDDVNLLKIAQNPTHAKQVTEMINLLKEDMCMGLGVPSGLLQQTVSTADPTAISYGLIVFRGKVDELRQYIAFHLRSTVEPLISKAISYKGLIEVAWNEIWLSPDVQWGPVYQVFKAKGIILKTLAELAVKQAQLLYDMHAISKSTYEEQIKWFR